MVRADGFLPLPDHRGVRGYRLLSALISRDALDQFELSIRSAVWCDLSVDSGLRADDRLRRLADGPNVAPTSPMGLGLDGEGDSANDDPNASID
jgi:hypothetical protein